MLDIFLNLLLFPIRWFWTKYMAYKEEENILKLICLFLASLSGIVLLSIVIFGSAIHIFTYYPEWVIIGGAIIWLYAYVKSKLFPYSDKPQPTPQMETPVTAPDINTLHQKAMNKMDVMANIVYWGFKEVAKKIECEEPKSIDEIIDIKRRYDIEDDVIFYVFRFEKADYRTTYDDNSIKGIIKTLELKINHMINSGKFRLYGIPTECDSFGECLNGIRVDDILNNEQYLYAWVTFDTTAYRNYLYRMNMKPQNNLIDTSLPNASWDDADV